MKIQVLYLFASVNFLWSVSVVAQEAAETPVETRNHAIWLNAGGGSAITHKGNSLFTLGGGLNYLYQSKHYINVNYTLGLSLGALTEPDQVTLLTSARLVYGQPIIHSAKCRISPFAGISYNRLALTTYRYDEETEAVTGITSTITGNETHTYSTANTESIGLPVGVNFLFTGKYYGFSLEPTICIGAHTYFGLTLGLINVGVIR